MKNCFHGKAIGQDSVPVKHFQKLSKMNSRYRHVLSKYGASTSLSCGTQGFIKMICTHLSVYCRLELL